MIHHLSQTRGSTQVWTQSKLKKRFIYRKKARLDWNTKRKEINLEIMKRTLTQADVQSKSSLYLPVSKGHSWSSFKLKQIFVLEKSLKDTSLKHSFLAVFTGVTSFFQVKFSYDISNQTVDDNHFLVSFMFRNPPLCLRFGNTAKSKSGLK